MFWSYKEFYFVIKYQISRLELYDGVFIRSKIISCWVYTEIINQYLKELKSNLAFLRQIFFYRIVSLFYLPRQKEMRQFFNIINRRFSK